MSDMVNRTFTAGGIETGSRTGFMFGIRNEIPVSSYFSLQPELMYTQKGFSMNVGSVPGSASLDYLSTAFLARVNIIPEGVIRPYAYAGPEVGINVGSDTSFSAGGTKVLVPISYSLIDLDLDMGAGLEASVGSGVSLFTEFRYSLGLNNVLSNPKPGASISTSTFQAIAGLKLNI